MALSDPPGCMHREHKPESVAVWLETWPLKARLLPTSINARNMLRILCVYCINKYFQFSANVSLFIRLSGQEYKLYNTHEYKNLVSGVLELPAISPHTGII